MRLLACKLAARPKQRELKATKSRMAMASTLLCSNNKEQTHFLPYILNINRVSVTLAKVFLQDSSSKTVRRLEFSEQGVFLADIQ